MKSVVSWVLRRLETIWLMWTDETLSYETSKWSLVGVRDLVWGGFQIFFMDEEDLYKEWCFWNGRRVR